MKDQKNDVVQRLTKAEMNKIRGGKSWICYVDGEYVGFVQADTLEEANRAVVAIYGEGYCTAYKVDTKPGLL